MDLLNLDSEDSFMLCFIITTTLLFLITGILIESLPLIFIFIIISFLKGLINELINIYSEKYNKKCIQKKT